MVSKVEGIDLLNLKKWIPNFFIDENTREALSFRENLLVCLKDASSKSIPIGGFCISVECFENQRIEFLVTVSSSYTLDNQFGGSKLINSSMETLHCLEEKRNEFLYTNHGIHEKELHMTFADSMYHMKVTKTCPCDTSKYSLDLSFSDNDGFLSEGANIVLMRYLALKNCHESFSLQCQTIDGTIVRCDYICSAAENVMFNGSCTEVYSIERIIYKDDETQVIKTFMNRNGKILKHDWQSLPYLLEINPLICLEYSKSLNRMWQQDVELISKYLDRKTCKMVQYTDYLSQHVEVKHLIEDYILALLTEKPTEILTFTIQHFVALAKNPEMSSRSSLFEESCLKDDLHRICSLCGICPDYNMTHLDSLRKGELSALHVYSKLESLCESCKDIWRDIYLYSFEEISKKIRDSSRKKNNEFDHATLSPCEIDSKCEEVCEGCKESKKKKLKSCQYQPDCITICEGCKPVDKAVLNSCEIDANCKNICEGCKEIDKTQLRICQNQPDCTTLCEGCKIDDKVTLNPCEIDLKCENFCKGCKESKKAKLSTCQNQVNCTTFCEGCKVLKTATLSTCSISQDCAQNCNGCKTLDKTKLNSCKIGDDSSCCEQDSKEGIELYERNVTVCNNNRDVINAPECCKSLISTDVKMCEIQQNYDQNCKCIDIL